VLGLAAIFPSYGACALGVAWLATGIPRTAIPAGDKTLRPGAVLDLLRIPQYRRFLMIYLVSSAGSSACFTFRAIYLASLGVPETAIGALYILPIAAEVLCFSYSQKMLERFGPIALIAAGPCFAAARWWLLSYMKYSPLLFVTEILHGLSFAVFYAGALAFVMQAVPVRLRGTAQVLFFSSTMALGRAIGAFAGGRMFDLLGMIAVLRIGGSLPAVAAFLHILSARSGAYQLKEAIPPVAEAPAETAQN
jgi:PPP family 3-phenylpropionic acid transporter